MKLNSNVEILEAAALMIDNLQKDAAFQKKMMVLGFTQERIQDGIALRQNALLMQDAKDGHYNEQWAISQQINKDVETILELFKEHVNIARIAYRQESAYLHAMKIQRFEKGNWQRVRQAQHFYTLVLGKPNPMKSLGITPPMLEQAKAAVDALLESRRERTRKKGMAQGSTQQKQKAFQELKAWVVEFRTAIRFAYRDNPQLLESFGIAVPSLK